MKQISSKEIFIDSDMATGTVIHITSSGVTLRKVEVWCENGFSSSATTFSWIS